MIQVFCFLVLFTLYSNIVPIMHPTMQEASPVVEQAPIVHDDGVFTLTIGPSTSTNMECSNEGASGNAPINVDSLFPFLFKGFYYNKKECLGYDAFTSHGPWRLRQTRSVIPVWWNSRRRR